MRRRRTVSLAAAGLILIATLASASPAAARGRVVVLEDGLLSPKALAGCGGPQLFVGQGWAGPPGPVFSYQLFGKGRGTTTDITPPLGVVDIAGTADGAGWAIGTDGHLYRQASAGAAIEDVFDIWGYQAVDIDPTDKDDPLNPGESNPNGLAAIGNDVLIADAAGNDVLRVNKDGDAVTVARWTNELVGTDETGIPGLPPLLPAEAVPTTVVIGPDGWAYVGQLVGFPGKPGSAHIWRVNPNAEGALCSVNAPTADCKVWKSGFTSIFDMAFRKNGALLVYEIAEHGWLAFEEGFATGDFPPAVLLEVKGNKRREIARGQLSQPGGVEAGRGGAIYVTDGMFTGGRLIEIRGG
jgi:hypothetical protein